MASIKLTGDTSGEITISAPAVAGTNTLTLPANTGTVITSATAAADVPSPTQLSTASGSAPSYSARAWVNFDGTGTPSIRASGNVSSITDVATGRYTVNFTTAMSDANHCVNVTQGIDGDSTINRTTAVYAYDASSVSFTIKGATTASSLDSDLINVAIFR